MPVCEIYFSRACSKYFHAPSGGCIQNAKNAPKNAPNRPLENLAALFQIMPVFTTGICISKTGLNYFAGLGRCRRAAQKPDQSWCAGTQSTAPDGRPALFSGANSRPGKRLHRTVSRALLLLKQEQKGCFRGAGGCLTCRAQTGCAAAHGRKCCRGRGRAQRRCHRPGARAGG